MKCTETSRYYTDLNEVWEASWAWGTLSQRAPVAVRGPCQAGFLLQHIKVKQPQTKSPYRCVNKKFWKEFQLGKFLKWTGRAEWRYVPQVISVTHISCQPCPPAYAAGSFPGVRSCPKKHFKIVKGHILWLSTVGAMTRELMSPGHRFVPGNEIWKVLSTRWSLPFYWVEFNVPQHQSLANVENPHASKIASKFLLGKVFHLSRKEPGGFIDMGDPAVLLLNGRSKWAAYSSWLEVRNL